MYSRRVKCAFCGEQAKPGYGVYYVRNDGVVLYFCSRKCRISFLHHGRNPKKTAWVVKKKASV